mgnify:FL=1
MICAIPSTLADLESAIALVPDFPKPGILFRDMSPLLAEHFPATISALLNLFSADEWAQVDALVGIESRGCLLAAGVAHALGKGVIVVRQPGQLPPPVLSQRYALEYGEDTLEMNASVTPRRVLLVDDVLATGGTLRATEALCRQAGHSIFGAVLLINLSALNDYRCQGHPARSLWTY